LSDTDRRQFFQQLGAVLAAAWASACHRPVAGAAVGPATSVNVNVASLTTDGATAVAPIPGPDGAPILVSRVHGKLLALSLHCTHEGCPVGSTPVNGVLRCPCHGSQFDLEGNVLHGPADTPLGQYETSYDARHHTLKVNFVPST